MFGRIKKWMGIKGTKLRLHLLPAYPTNVETINGELEIFAKSPQRVTGLEIKFYETYARGKGEKKRIDEYLLGTWVYDEPFDIDEQTSKMILFKLEYEAVKSNMDKIADKGPLRRGLVNLAKSFRSVSSEYRLEAEATVEGLNWKPFTSEKVKFQ